MIAQLKKIGIEPGKSFDLDKAAPAVRKALTSAIFTKRTSKSRPAMSAFGGKADMAMNGPNVCF
jgi:hypothetical protein